ncbi:hypothetical protein YPPY94_0479, partial [Yersinia pestis PY-94]
MGTSPLSVMPVRAIRLREVLSVLSTLRGTEWFNRI